MGLGSGDRRFDLILSDNDGCLVGESSSAFDLVALGLVRAHNERATARSDVPLLTICSGRPQPFVEALCRMLAVYGAPAIAENGVWMYDALANEYHLDPSISDEHLSAVADLRRWLVRQFGRCGAEAHAGGISLQPGKVASVSVYHPDADYVRQLLDRLRVELAKRYPRSAGGGDEASGLFRVSMTELYINCDLAHVSKGTAIDRLMHHTGLTRERLAGIGDMPSDLAIRDRVSWFACPANAVDEVKARADYVSPYAETRGVVDILERLSQD